MLSQITQRSKKISRKKVREEDEDAQPFDDLLNIDMQNKDPCKLYLHERSLKRFSTDRMKHEPQVMKKINLFRELIFSIDQSHYHTCTKNVSCISDVHALVCLNYNHCQVV